MRFSLRPLFVVVAMIGMLCAWMTHTLRWKSLRAAAYESLYEKSAGVMASPTTSPAGLWLVGDQGWKEIVIFGSANAKIDEASLLRLFPEARIFHVYDQQEL